MLVFAVRGQTLKEKRTKTKNEVSQVEKSSIKVNAGKLRPVCWQREFNMISRTH